MRVNRMQWFCLLLINLLLNASQAAGSEAGWTRFRVNLPAGPAS